MGAKPRQPRIKIGGPTKELREAKRRLFAAADTNELMMEAARFTGTVIAFAYLTSNRRRHREAAEICMELARFMAEYGLGQELLDGEE